MATRNVKPMTNKRLSIADFEEQAMAALGQPPGYTLILSEDESVPDVHIPHPLLVAEDRLKAIQDAQSGADLDTEEIEDPETGRTVTVTKFPRTIDGKPADPEAVRLARAVLGPAEHKRFLAHGGKSTHVALAWEAMAAEVQSMAPKRGK
jgi:hypothetical protein